TGITSGVGKAVSLTAANGAVTSANANLDVDAGAGGNVSISANLGIGTSTNPIDVSAANLAAQSTTGNVFITSRGDVTLRDIGGVTNNAGGADAYFNVSVDASQTGNLTVAGNVATVGSANVTLTANSVVLNSAVGNTGNVFTRL